MEKHFFKQLEFFVANQIIVSFYCNSHVGCDCEAGWTGDYCEYQLDQLQTNGIATEVFVAFVVGLIALLLTVGVCFCVRTGKNRSGTYATTAVRETHVNPYGDEEEEEEDEYELKEVTII